MEVDYYRLTPYALFILIAALAYIFVTGKLTALWNTYEIPTAILLIFAFILIAWIYGNIRPGFKGKFIGTFILYGRMGRAKRRFEGLFVDISDYFDINSIKALRDVALSDLKAQLQVERDQVKIAQINRQIEALEKITPEDIKKRFYIYGTRRDFVRYVWVWFSDRSMEDQSFYSVITSFTFPYGFVPRQSVDGIQINLAYSVNMKGYGKVKVRLFIPTIWPEMSIQEEQKIQPEFAEAVMLLASAVRTAVAKITKDKETQKLIKSLKKANEEKDKLLAECTAERDAARAAAASTNLWEMTEEEKRLPQNRLKGPNYAGMLIATVFGSLLFGSILPKYISSITPVVASMIGALAFGIIFIVLVNRQ